MWSVKAVVICWVVVSASLFSPGVGSAALSGPCPDRPSHMAWGEPRRIGDIGDVGYENGGFT